MKERRKEKKMDNRKIEKDVYIKDHFVFHGMITGRTTVSNTGSFILHGMCTQDVILEKDGRARIHGTVIGDIQNNGGMLEILGTVNGNVMTSDDGKTIIDEKALVGRNK